MSIVTAQGHLACAEDDGEATSDEPAGQHESTPVASPNEDTSPRSLPTFSQSEGSLTRTPSDEPAGQHESTPAVSPTDDTSPCSIRTFSQSEGCLTRTPAAPTAALVASSSPVAPQTPITPARVVASVQQERLGTYQEDDDEDPRFNGQGKGSFIRAEYPWLIQKRKRPREEGP